MRIKLILFLSFLATITYSQEDKKDKTVELKEVIVTQQKKAVEQKADRTIFDFSSQAQLNSVFFEIKSNSRFDVFTS